MASDSAIHSLAGAAGGILAMTATYPLIFLSTRSAVDVKKTDKSTVQAIKDIIEREGLTGLYSGLNSSLLGIAITNGVYYFFYEGSKTSIIRRKPGSKALTTLESMLAGLLAGTATTLISNPVWVIQTSQAVRTVPDESAPIQKKLGFVQTAKHIVRKDGVSGFWRGIYPALILVMNPILQYTAFEQLKNFLIARRTLRLRSSGSAGKVILSDLDYFWLGAVSKLIATSTTYPYIVIKSRLQAGYANALRYKSSLDGILTVIREEGISGLYKGVGNKLVQSVLTAAILFASQKRIYELIKKSASVVNQ